MNRAVLLECVPVVVFIVTLWVLVFPIAPFAWSIKRAEAASDQSKAVAVWTARDTSHGFQLTHGDFLLEIDSRRGTIRQVEVGGKAIVWANNQPLLQASLIESRAYDQRTDYIPDQRRLLSTYVSKQVDYALRGGQAVVTIHGSLQFPGSDAIDFEVKLIGERSAAQTGSGQSTGAAPPAMSEPPTVLPSLQMEVRLEPKGEFVHRYVRDVRLHLPLALNPRKRIAQGGDQGFTWDTRYFYQFHLNTLMGLLAEPDRNEWRLFGVDQMSPVSYQLWRSESESTAPLIMQQGVQAAGWTSVYDEAGGVLFAYRDLARLAPKALRVEAWERGAAVVLLHPDSARAFSPHGSQAAKRVFGVPHRIDWLFFAGTYADVNPTAMLAKRWGVTSLPSDPPIRENPKFTKVRDAWLPPHVATGDLAPWVTGGVALPRGKVWQPQALRLLSEDRELPFQAEPLAYWPDGSVKWLLLTFQYQDAPTILRPKEARGGRISEVAPWVLGDPRGGERIPFVVTTRQDWEHVFALALPEPHVGATPPSDSLPAAPGVAQSGLGSLRVTEHEGGVSIDTGPLQIELQRGPAWIRRIALRGETIVAPQANGAEEAMAFVDFLRVSDPYVTQTAHAMGELDSGPVVIDDIRVETAGPYRAVVRLEGQAQSKEPARVIIRLEVGADRTYVRLYHTVEFLHQDPRQAFVRQMGIRLPTLLEAKDPTITVGGETGSLQLTDWQAAGLRQASHLAYAIWQQDDHGLTEQEHRHRSAGWIDVSDGRRGVLVAIRNMWQEAPNELVASRDDATLTAYFWPSSVPPMDVRRYSNYPHLSQGESVSDRNDWVETSYYGRDPFVGVSKSHEVMWLFHDVDVATDQLGAVVADFQSPPLIYMGEAWYRENGLLLPQPDPAAFPLVTANREHVAQFWLHHQKLFGWYGKWHYGDIQHYFNSGYGSIVAPGELARVLALPPSERAATTFGSTQRQLDYAPQHHWAFDNGRWGWGNTEGLPGLLFQREYLRTGDREFYFAAEAFARQARDVVIRHAGRWFGRGTRHGVQPWSDGNHEERQVIHSEFRFHHYLSGDMRSREVARKLLHQYFLTTNVSVHAGHSGRLYGLLTNWEMTGDPELGEILRRYVHSFIVPEGIAASPSVSFPQVATGTPRDINSDSMFFHVFGATHALIEYYYLTEDDALRQALVKMAAHLMKTLPARPTSENPSWLVIAFAARHADDPAPFQAFLNAWFQQAAWQYAYQMVSHDPAHWSGPTAFILAGVPGIHFWMNALPYLMTAFDEEPVPTAVQREQMDRLNESGRRWSPPMLGWQSEYDQPEFEPFLGPWRPWKVPVSIRFLSDLRDEANLRGQVPLAVEVAAEAAEDLVDVRIAVDGVEVGSGVGLAAPRAFVLDTLALADGPHTLAVTAVHRTWGPITETIRFRVRNWWQLTEELEPPISAFGAALEVLQAEYKSDGWRYVGDQPHLFFGDATRLVRESATDEVLIWSTPALRELEVTVYVQRHVGAAALAGGLGLAVSADGTRWRDLPVAPRSVEEGATAASDTDWEKVAVSLPVPADMAANWFRLTLSAGLPADGVQLGRVVLKGLLGE